MSIMYSKLDRWKYRTEASYSYLINAPLKSRPKEKVGLGGKDLNSRLVTYDPDTDMLTMRLGYCWDGPSGPMVDTLTAMRGSLVHDGWYQLLRMGLLPQATRDDADETIYKIFIEDGMSKFRAKYALWALKKFAGYAAKAGTQHVDILTAP